MRILGSIKPEVRSQLKLGESPRARADLDIRRLGHLIAIDPENTEKYMYELGLRYQEINFFSRESETWRAFIRDFPASQHISMVKQYASESLRKWGYLLYKQGRYTKAVELLNESLQMDPNNKTARMWLGHASKAARKGDRFVEPIETADQ
jgi:tetratricopeptide (TPR) repeat protein